MAFKYSVLENAQDIRLLHLTPGVFTDDLKCDMVNINLDDQPPEYTALSYVWGNATDTVPITCNGCKVNVTKNLETALRRLRETDKSTTLWADALCINQTDIPERNNQVLMMKRIYGTARLVVAYVGEETEDTKDGFGLMGKLFTASELVTEQDELTKILQEAYAGRNTSMFAIPPQYDQAWVALQNFYRRDYFARIWVVQEIALASADPRVICGEHKTWWKEIMVVAKLLSLSWIRDTRSLDNSFLAHTMGLFRKMVQAGDFLPLSMLLTGTGRFRSTDPRDKIFALYGLASDIYDADGKPLLAADYSDTTERAYSSIATFLIQTSGRLDVLEYGGDHTGTNYPGLPSWVPDWNSARLSMPLYLGIGPSAYAAERHMEQCYIKVSPDRTQLLVLAILVDKVETIAQRFREEHFAIMPYVRAEPGTLVRLWKEVVETLGEDYCWGGTTVNAFWRTLIASINKDRFAVDESWYVHFLHYWREARICDLEAEQYARETVRGKEAPTISEHEEQKLVNGMMFTVRDEQEALKRLARHSFHARRAEDLGAEHEQNCTGAPPGCDECLEIDDEACAHVYKLLPRLREDDPCVSMIEEDRFIADWYRRLRNDIYDPLPIMHMSERYNEYAGSLAKFTLDRTFFLTSEGLMGLGPPNMKSDDEVAIVGGSKVPLILRPISNEPEDNGLFTLVGEAYVHGIMDGSAAECSINEEGEQVLALITLR